MRKEGAPTALDHRRRRGEATKRGLMRAAEKLIAEKGIENVTIRQIVGAAGQKNESALQYHFRSLPGLIEALRHERDGEVQARRASMLADMLAADPAPSLRQLCELMVRPLFDLARRKPEFRLYVQAFSHEIIFAETSALAKVGRRGGGNEGGRQLGALLRARVPHLDEAGYRRRMDAALRLAAASMSHQARQKNAFRGLQADLFFHSLLDALVGLLGAPESAETKTAADAARGTGVESATGVPRRDQ